MNPASASGHCRVTVVAPNTRVDVALPEDVPLAELLPEVLRLLGDGSTAWPDGPGPAGGAGQAVGGGVPRQGRAPSGSVLTAGGGRVLDTALSLAAQGVLHGELLRLRAPDDLPEAPVHDDIVDAVAEAVLGAGRLWSAAALRAASLTAVALALGLGALALWMSAADPPGAFHGSTAVVAGFLAASLLGGGVWRARYAVPVRGRASYYLSAAGPVVSGGRQDSGSPDFAAAAVLTSCALPYAFIAGFGVVATDDGHGLGRVQFTTGSALLMIAALLALLGLGRRVAAAVAGTVVGFAGMASGIGMVATKCAPVSAVAVVAACCALAIEILPHLAMSAARFLIEAPGVGPDAGEFDGAPVDAGAVGQRVDRTREMMLGLVGGVSVLIVVAATVLVIPVSAFGTATGDLDQRRWEQVLAVVVAGLALCRARLFRDREPVLALVAGGLAALTAVGAGVAMAASAADRGTWLVATMVGVAMAGLALSTVRARRGSVVAVLPPRWGRMVDVAEGALVLAVLPVLLAVLGTYGLVMGLHSKG